MKRIEINARTGEKTVVQLSQGEIDEINARMNTPVSIKQQIAELEALQTPRLTREAITAPNTIFDTATGQTVLERMAELDAQIAALRLLL